MKTTNIPLQSIALRATTAILGAMGLPLALYNLIKLTGTIEQWHFLAAFAEAHGIQQIAPLFRLLMAFAGFCGGLLACTTSRWALAPLLAYAVMLAIFCRATTDGFFFWSIYPLVDQLGMISPAMVLAIHVWRYRLMRTPASPATA